MDATIELALNVCTHAGVLLSADRIHQDDADVFHREAATVKEALEVAVREPHFSVSLRQRLLHLLSSVITVIEQVTSTVVGYGYKRLPQVTWENLASSFKSRIQTGVIVNLDHIEMKDFLQDAEDVFVTQIERILHQQNALKVNFLLNAVFSKLTGEQDTKTFNTKNAPIFQYTDLRTWFQEHVNDPLLQELDEFQEKDSGWTLDNITNLIVNINLYNPLRGSSYIDLPGPIKRRHACINVKTDDNECFRWAVLSALHPRDHSQHPYRVTHYIPFRDELNFCGIEFPIQLKDVHKFERQNPISINVYALELRNRIYNVVPVHVTKMKKDVHVNLLMIQNDYIDEEDIGDHNEDVVNQPIRFHYVWIKDLSRLVSSQISKKNSKQHICDRCLHFFRTLVKLHTHEVDCMKVNKCRVRVPTGRPTKLGFRDDVVSFQNFNNKEPVPFAIYADIECLLKPINQQAGQNTRTIDEHEPFAIGYYLHCNYNDALSGYHSYRGEEAATWFVNQLMNIAQRVEEVYDNPAPMNLSSQEEADFHAATHCHICERPLRGTSHRDHCHLTGRYRGASHPDCNLNFQSSRVIPVVFHNFTGYDAHFMIKDVALRAAGRVNVLPLNMERYISVTKHLEGCSISFRFIDSFRFMASSLEKLASYLVTIPITRHQFSDLDDIKFKLLTRKGVFPYEHISSRANLDETSLPPREAFYSHLTDTPITDGEYQHAESVWKAFSMATLGDYADLYLKTDVLLLADDFDNFRRLCLSTYKLDPLHYYTAPGLTWDAMLKFIHVELQLLNDIDMVMFIERGIRGGVSQCSNRYAAANNRYMFNYNPEEPEHYLMYYDVNNLYGWAMIQALPFGDFKWADPATVWNVPDDALIGYIMEVNLE